MELRNYWAIIWRRSWIIAFVIGIALLITAYQAYALNKAGQFKSYHSTITLRVGLQVTNQSTNPTYADYITISESLADEYTTGPVLTSADFAHHVSQQVGQDTTSIAQRYGDHPNLGSWQSDRAISGAISQTRIHSLVTISVDWPTDAGAWAIAQAIGEVSTKSIAHYLDYEVRALPTSTVPNLVHPIAGAEVVSAASQPVQASIYNKLIMLLLIPVVALVIAFALAFLIEYLDDHIRQAEEVTSLLQLPIYGEIPHVPAPGQRKPQQVTRNS